MKNNLTITTGSRVFLIHHTFAMGKKDLCNIEQLEQLVNESNGITKIEHFWNHKFIKISKKDLKAMLEAMSLNTDFLKLI